MSLKDGTESKFGLAVLGSLTASVILWWLQSRFKRSFPLSTFINPESVADVASQLPENEDEFIMSAWQVASDIQYVPLETEFHIVDHSVECERCHLPNEVLKLGKGNCVGKSVLLTSILRNRVPPDRVYMVVGDLHLNGNGGHSWAVVEHNDEWYLLEPTGPPKGWIEASSLAAIYTPKVFFNDQTQSCLDNEICITIGGECQECLLRAIPYNPFKTLY